MAQCKQCGKTFEAKRSTAQYCSVGCRVRASRVSVTRPDTLSDSVTPDVIPSVTPYKAPVSHKRGADIQCFADLPPDVQADVERYSRAYTVDGHEYTKEQDRAARTARAIKYQHLFPDRYHPRGNSQGCSYVEQGPLPQGQFNRVAKPGDPDYVGVCVKVGDTWQVGGGIATAIQVQA